SGPHNLSLSGEIKAGFMKKTRVVGSNGIVDTTWAVDVPMMCARSSAGEQCEGTLPKSKRTASHMN
ncbi:MAG: hypothetical protein ACI9ZT_000001, partial [Gammaproteobacteria bacterium]